MTMPNRADLTGDYAMPWSLLVCLGLALSLTACRGSGKAVTTPTPTPSVHDILNSALLSSDELGSGWSRTPAQEPLTDERSWCTSSAANAIAESEFFVALATKRPGSSEAPTVRESIQLFDAGAAEEYMAGVRSGCAKLGFTDDFIQQHGDHSVYLVHSSPGYGALRILLIRRSDVLLKLSVYLANEPGEAQDFDNIVARADGQLVDAVRTLGTAASVAASPTSTPATTTDKLLNALLTPSDLGSDWSTMNQTTPEDAQRALTEPCQLNQATAVRAAGRLVAGEKLSAAARQRPQWNEILAILAPDDMRFYLQQLTDACRATTNFAELPLPSLGDQALHFARVSSSCCAPLRELVVVRLGAALLQVQYDEGDETRTDDARFLSLLDEAYKQFETTIQQISGAGAASARSGRAE
jgi:hypothetical protein